MESLALRPRRATEIIDAAVEVYRRNPIHFLLLAAVVRVPWVILQIIFVAGKDDTMEGASASMLIGAGSLLTYFLMSGLVVDMASQLYLGHETDAFETLRRVAPKIISVFIASIGQTIAIIAGLLLFLFPAVWVTAALFAVIPIVVIEKRGVSVAFDRSTELSKGMKMHILSAIGLVVIIRVVVEGGIGLLGFLIPMLPLRYVVVAAASMLIYPLLGISEALIYYDIRIRKEGFDIEMMAQQVAEPSPVTA